MYRLKYWDKYLESIANKPKKNDIEIPILDISEQLEFLYDIIGKNSIDYVCDYCAFDLNGKPIYNDDYYSNMFNGIKSKNKYRLAICMDTFKCNFFVHHLDSYESIKMELNEFCDHLENLLSDEFDFSRFLGRRDDGFVRFHFIMVSKKFIDVNEDKEEIIKELKSRLFDYKITNGRRLSIGIDSKGFMFNRGAIEEVNGVLNKIRENWNISDLKSDDDGYYIDVLYPTSGELTSKLKSMLYNE